MDHQAAQKFVDEVWMDDIVPELVEYIKIPNKSPHFDPDWEKNGYMEDAVQQIFAWCKKQDIPRAWSARSCGWTGGPRLFSSTSRATRTTPSCCTATSTSSLK
jgi:hypothetical protein